MYTSAKFSLFGTAICIAASVAGCGGASSSSGKTASAPPGNEAPASQPGTDVPSVPPAGSDIVISGVAASGAPFVNAAVAIVDRNGNTVSSGLTDAFGFFKLNVNPLYAGPLIVQASRGNAVGGKDTLIALADTRTSTTVNVNTISNVVAALVSATGDPSTLVADFASGKVTFDAKVIESKWLQMGAKLLPLLNALGPEIGALRNGFAPADGTGPDQLLDALDISITQNKDKTSNIEITIKTAEDGQQMPVIRFTNSTRLASILAQNGITPTTINNKTITAASLPASGTSAQIAELLKRMTACYALPTAKRVNLTTGTGGNIIAPECKSLFKNDSPAAYLHFGAGVGADGAFSTLFSDAGTGTGFSQGSYEYKQSNGDIVFSLVSVDQRRVLRNEEYVASLGTDGRLKLIGNQYPFAGSINPMAELHYFIDGGKEIYLSTGYNIKVPLQSTATGAPIIRVDLTSPTGKKYSLVSGSEAMVFPILDSGFKPQTSYIGDYLPSGSAFLRLSSMTWSDLQSRRNDMPRDMPYAPERNLYSARQTETDEMIQAYLPRGVWVFEYFTGSSITPVARQNVRTKARALTLGEASASAQLDPDSAFTLTPSSLASLRSLPRPQTDPSSASPISLGGLTSLDYDWAKESQDRAPVLLPVFTRVYGFADDNGSMSYGNFPYGGLGAVLDFSRITDLTPTTRKAAVTCGDSIYLAQCGSDLAYSSNARLDGIQLLSRDAQGREFSSFASAWRFLP
ncbi:carboxypeptidase-like regulatory domain-containing protein|uniref:carboxypeptidase-like regulatory domain-containing protein n=1 Tax=Noviherbaspirillum sp. L7-7A TaxID=2850560 RepID=UPI001C2CB59A|nr:carboxypeptidase-like regulatory domain-containing protein [Noviherbaspirillum sp. L7-7A]MBV0878759.1 carboxypeptidase-like regulatory domain-containing protein [Noviherbaspirillum sp. L7-7A]